MFFFPISPALVQNSTIATFNRLSHEVKPGILPCRWGGGLWISQLPSVINRIITSRTNFYPFLFWFRILALRRRDLIRIGILILKINKFESKIDASELNLLNVQLTPALTDFKGPTIFICYLLPIPCYH